MPRKSACKVAFREIRSCMRPALLLLASEEVESSDDEAGYNGLHPPQPPKSLLGFPFSGTESPQCWEDFERMFNDSESDSETDGEVMCQLVVESFQSVSETCYIAQRSNLSRSVEYRYTYFDQQPDEEFRLMTRLTKRAFRVVLDLIVGDPIFANNNLHKQAHVHWQLACTLDHLGNDGQGASVGRSKIIWGAGKGTMFDYFHRVIVALCKLWDTYIVWPDVEERADIVNCCGVNRGFEGVVGFVDGTTFPLHCKPSFYGNNYMDRKKRYSISAQVVCDPQHTIRHFLTGAPGSCHDFRVFSLSPLVERPEDHFSPGEYLVTDSTYKGSTFIIPTYKSSQRDFPHDEEEPTLISRFNTLLAEARVYNEHTIGILKSRWTSLRYLRLLLLCKKDIQKVVEHTIACVVLHNIATNHDPWENWEPDDSPPLNPLDDKEPRIGLSGMSAARQRRFQVRQACLLWDCNREERRLLVEQKQATHVAELQRDMAFQERDITKSHISVEQPKKPTSDQATSPPKQEGRLVVKEPHLSRRFPLEPTSRGNIMELKRATQVKFQKPSRAKAGRENYTAVERL